MTPTHSNQTHTESQRKTEGIKRSAPWWAEWLLSLAVGLLGVLLILSLPLGALGPLTAWMSAQQGHVPPFVTELRSLGGPPTSLQHSLNLALAIANRIERINRTRDRLLDDEMVQALARADWYYVSGQDVGQLYGGRPVQITEGRLLSAVRRFLQQRGGRLPVTQWHAPLSDGSLLTGQIPPSQWASRPPSDRTLQGFIRTVRSRLLEQVPEITGGRGGGATLRPLEAALVAYVLLTADNGWIGAGRADIDLSAAEMRSFLLDLGIAFPRR
jgi:hypothetical protein